MICVNPLLIGELISTADTLETTPSRIMCQSPSHRGTHFYANLPRPQRRPDGVCQSPSHRGTHFYVDLEAVVSITVELCQSPSHRGTHFYGIYYAFDNYGYDVSIPFSSGNSFLHFNGRMGQPGNTLVSIPFSSGNSFLRRKICLFYVTC